MLSKIIIIVGLLLLLTPTALAPRSDGPTLHDWEWHLNRARWDLDKCETARMTTHATAWCTAATAHILASDYSRRWGDEI